MLLTTLWRAIDIWFVFDEYVIAYELSFTYVYVMCICRWAISAQSIVDAMFVGVIQSVLMLCSLPSMLHLWSWLTVGSLPHSLSSSTSLYFIPATLLPLIFAQITAMRLIAGKQFCLFMFIIYLFFLKIYIYKAIALIGGSLSYWFADINTLSRSVTKARKL